jgi:tRNA G18 (ribose-2'-O)-methylase SpoU
LGVAWFLLAEERLDEVASVPANSGLCGVFSARGATLEELAARRFLLVAWEISDPGNLGTLVRACRALTGGGVLCVGGCSAWSAKVARASAGSLLGTPLTQVCREQGEQALDHLLRAGFGLYAAAPRAGLKLAGVSWTGKDAVLLGNETRGLGAAVLDRVKATTFDIPCQAGVDSLNVAMAGSIVAWEWSRLQGT